MIRRQPFAEAMFFEREQEPERGFRSLAEAAAFDLFFCKSETLDPDKSPEPEAQLGDDQNV